MLEKRQSEKIITSSLKRTQKAFLMKDLLASAWASYQHLPIKLSQALLCGSIFWFFPEHQREALLALSFPLLPRPGTGFWIGTNGIRLFGPVQSSSSLPPHSSSRCFFLKVALLPNKCTFENNMSHVEPLTNTPPTCPLSRVCLCLPSPCPRRVCPIHILTPSSFLFAYLPGV